MPGVTPPPTHFEPRPPDFAASGDSSRPPEGRPASAGGRAALQTLESQIKGQKWIGPQARDLIARASACDEASGDELIELVDQAALHAQIDECRYLWSTVSMGLGDWSFRVNHERSVTRPLLGELDALQESLGSGAAEGRFPEISASIRLRLREIRVHARLLETDHRYRRKREGRWNQPANYILDRAPLAKKRIRIDEGGTAKEYKDPRVCANIAEQALEAARAGFANRSANLEQALDEIDAQLHVANQNMSWYDKLRGDFVETWGVTPFAYLPSILLIEPYLRKLARKGEMRWDRSTRWRDMLKLLAFKEIFNMLVRFLLMGRDYSLRDKETVSGPVVEIIAGAAVTGAVTFGSSYTERFFNVKQSPLRKALIDTIWGMVAGYFGGVATWAAIPESARGGSLNDCGWRAVKNDVFRFGLGHVLIHGYNYLEHFLWPSRPRPGAQDASPPASAKAAGKRSNVVEWPAQKDKKGPAADTVAPPARKVA